MGCPKTNFSIEPNKIYGVPNIYWSGPNAHTDGSKTHLDDANVHCCEHESKRIMHCVHHVDGLRGSTRRLVA